MGGGEVSYGSRSPWRVILRDEEAQRNRMSDRDMRVTKSEMMKVYMYIVQLNISNFQNSYVVTCMYVQVQVLYRHNSNFMHPFKLCFFTRLSRLEPLPSLQL